MRLLKILHLVLMVLFLGGILSSIALSLTTNLANFDVTYHTYKSLIIISDNIVRNGAVGTLLLGVVYGFFTTWGFFKHKWLTVKWIIFIVQTFLGIFMVDRLMVANMALLESEKAMALNNPVFLHNHFLRQYIVIAQIALTLFIVIISVIKPWRSKRKAQKLAIESKLVPEG